MPPILFPISSNGFTTTSTAFVTHLAAMNAIHINTRAIMSTTMVQNMPPVVSSALCAPFTELAVLSAIFSIPGRSHITLPRNSIFVVQSFTIFTVLACAGSFAFVIFLVIVSTESISQPSHLILVASQDSTFDHVVESGDCTAAMMTRPNESVSPTTAGRKQSPINSFMSNDSVPFQKSSLPATKCNVKIGENTAYIQSLMPRIRSMAVRAMTSTQNTRNMRAHDTT